MAQLTESARISLLENEVQGLRQMVGNLTAFQPLNVSITTLAPSELVLLREIPIIVKTNGEDFLATQYDSGIGASGDTDDEAIANLKDILIQKYMIFEEMPENQLGEIPKKQLAVLRTFISKG